ncbi:hypothetical protein V6N13_084905 [Hibiscus sabdariffa]|uniref:Uncharacterized protein n=1 Tax=Hibiscus sabdariffa TaxID=183260 RepID=A0ABR2CZV8_9ROSI
MERQSGKVLDDEYVAPEVGDARGIQGSSVTAPAVQGVSVTAPAVQGSSTSAPAVQGSSSTAPEVQGSSSSAPDLYRGRITATWEYMSPEVAAIFRARGLSPP